MKLSIVVPTLNEEANIANCVASAFALRDGWPAELEVVVADGGSLDATADRAREAGAHVVVGASGRGRQLRNAVEHTTGDVVLMLHADTRLSPQAGGQLAMALQDPAVGCGAFRQRIEARGVLYRLLEAGNAFRARRWRMPYGDQAIFVRRDLLDRVGGVPDMPLMEDVELMLRLRRHTRPLLLDGPLLVSSRRWRRVGVLRQTGRNWALFAAYRCGIDAARLARWYRPEVPSDAPSFQQRADGGAGEVVEHPG